MIPRYASNCLIQYKGFLTGPLAGSIAPEGPLAGQDPLANVRLNELNRIKVTDANSNCIIYDGLVVLHNSRYWSDNTVRHHFMNRAHLEQSSPNKSVTTDIFFVSVPESGAFNIKFMSLEHTYIGDYDRPLRIEYKTENSSRSDPCYMIEFGYPQSSL